MAEINHRFHKGRMNKDLDERLVPNGEYRDALNVEVVTSEGSDIGSLQTIMGNVNLSKDVIDPGKPGTLDGYCIGSIADKQNDKIYWLIAGYGRDIIAEYDPMEKDPALAVRPVVVDIYAASTPAHSNSGRVLNFDRFYLITGINIVDGILFWTDNNTEPKRINIERAKLGSPDFFTHSDFYVREGSVNSQTINYVSVGPIKQEHITVIKKSPPTAPTLEMLSTRREDLNEDDLVQVRSSIGPQMNGAVIDCSLFMDPASGLYHTNDIDITFNTDLGTPDFKINDYIIISYENSNHVKKEIRAQILTTGFNLPSVRIRILSGDPGLICEESDNVFQVELEQKPSLFQFKFPRFGYRYKYEDGEYSTFSPFTEVAFLPNNFDYLPREGYNLGMVNNLRKLAIKDFVHGRLIPDDVISIDILYKESNSPNVYTVKTIKRQEPNGFKYDEWNAISEENTINNVNPTVDQLIDMVTTGYVKIDSELIHSVVPSNQTLRPWDNVPRKALAQEITGNRLVYANYLQNYNLNNSNKYKSPQYGGVGTLNAVNDINADIELGIVTRTIDTIGDLYAEQINPLYYDFNTPGSYNVGKSIKTLRTYQLGVIYIDEFGRETPVFSNSRTGSSSLYLPKDSANKETKLKARLYNTPPEWAKSFKFFIKETSNEYYNLALDRWYNAEDGNIWLSFPSSERNKVDIETFLILKKQHHGNDFVDAPARYKILAIENQAPTFIKTERSQLGEFQDDTTSPPAAAGFGWIGKPNNAGSGYPLPNVQHIFLHQSKFEQLGWAKIDHDASTTNSGPGFEGVFYLKDPGDFEIRIKVPGVGYSKYYKVKSVEWEEPTTSGTDDPGWYKITLRKPLGDDASITSTGNSYVTRQPNTEIELFKSEVNNKPEFEGRFFAKIKKDFTLIETIIKPSSALWPEDEWLVTNSATVQYISPYDSVAAHGSFLSGGFFNTPGTTGSGADTNLISIDISNGDGEFSVGPVNTGVGQSFWKQASAITLDPLLDSANTPSGNNESSGWFIDAVEGFRNFKYTEKYFHSQDSNYYTSSWAKDKWDNNLGFQNRRDNWAKMKGHEGDFSTIAGNNQLQVIGTGTEGSGWYPGPPGSHVYNYLGISGNRGPDEPSIGSRMLKHETNIVPSIGIDAANGVVHLSYSGVGINEEVNVSDHLSQTWNLANDHVSAASFINTLMTPGTLWRWKEDPDQIIYKTISPNGGGYTSQEWGANRADALDGNDPGIGLYNYTTFYDYPINHHQHNYLSSFPVVQMGDINHSHTNLVSQLIPDLPHNSNFFGPVSPPWYPSLARATYWAHNLDPLHIGTNLHDATTSSGYLANGGAPPVGPAYNRYPMLVREWNEPYNRRKRYMFRAEPYKNPGAPLGSTGASRYLPTNDCLLTPHFEIDSNGAITKLGTVPTTKAPGIRPDGMYSGHNQPGGSNTVSGATIPSHRYQDQTSPTPQIGAPAGSVTWEIVELYDEERERHQSTNPAVFETEPKEDVGLDIYHEVGQIYPITLNEDNIEQFIGPLSYYIDKNPKVRCFTPTGGVKNITTDSGQGSYGDWNDIRVESVNGTSVVLASLQDTPHTFLDALANTTHIAPETNDILTFTRSDGSITSATVRTVITNGPAVEYELYPNVHNHEVTLPWFNCYSFGNGVESDRIRDDFNQVTIDNGPKASTILEEPYAEERRSSGLIYSGIYNSTSGINNLNQFIQAEKITKDLNPIYGSIQKLFARNTNLVTFCEDKVFKILANKDALFNADGNPQLTASSNVLGQTIPFVGEFGISKNPESFASESYRAYFADQNRGVILRLSQDGITAISEAGMKDYFADNLPGSTRVLGSFDDKKHEYNVTIDYQKYTTLPKPLPVTILADVTDVCVWSGSIQPPGCGELGGIIRPTTIRVPSNYNIHVGDVVVGVNFQPGCTVTSVGNPFSHPNQSNVYYKDVVLSCDVIGTLPDATREETEEVYSKSGFQGVFATLYGYNIEMSFYTPAPFSYKPTATVSFSELSKGWVSFKSWYQESGVSLNNKYYTFGGSTPQQQNQGGHIWEHHANELRNNFYNTQYDSTVRILFNDKPGSVKSFQTLNYEGTQSRIWEHLKDPEYWNNITKAGWYVDDIYTNLQEGEIQQFKSKEDIWYAQIRGTATEWLDDGKAGNIDTREFSYQGIDESIGVEIITGGYTSWDCEATLGGTPFCVELQNTSGAYATKLDCLNDTDSPCKNIDSGPFDCNPTTGYCEPTPGGEFTTLQECIDQSICTSHPYDCDPECPGCQCVPTVNGRFTGTPGVETAEEECLRETDCTWSDKWDCTESNTCHPSLFGQYNSQQECIDAGCGPLEDYDCNDQTGECEPLGTYTGLPYASYNECIAQSPCGPPNEESPWGCDLETGDCYQSNIFPPGTDTWTTEYDCLLHSTCGGGSLPWACINDVSCEYCAPSPTGTYSNQAECMAMSCCGSVNPCDSEMSIVQHIVKNPTWDGQKGGCNDDGEIEIGVIPQSPNNSAQWIIEITDSSGVDMCPILTPPCNNPYASNTSVLFKGFGPGIYNVKVTDEFGCIKETQFEMVCVSTPPPPCSCSSVGTVTVNITDATTAECDNGAASITVNPLNCGDEWGSIRWMESTNGGSTWNLIGTDLNVYTGGQTSADIHSLLSANLYMWSITTTDTTTGEQCEFSGTFDIDCVYNNLCDPASPPWNISTNVTQQIDPCGPGPATTAGEMTFQVDNPTNGATFFNWEIFDLDNGTYTTPGTWLTSGTNVAFGQQVDINPIDTPPGLLPDVNGDGTDPNLNQFYLVITDSEGCSIEHLVDVTCTGVILGCTDPSAPNYDPLAVIDDGSCCYNLGCTDTIACNYDPAACDDDGSCIYVVYGCTVPGAINYYAGATTDDGSCIFPDCPDTNLGFNVNGATLPSAAGGGTYNTPTGITPNSCNDLEAYQIALRSGTQCTVGSPLDAFPYCQFTPGSADMNEPITFGCDTTVVTPIYGWDDLAGGGALAWAALPGSPSGSWQPVWTDPTTATPPGFTYVDISCCSGGATVYGCTDSSATNYNSLATIDDGSCI